jgi:hypothetical protein
MGAQRGSSARYRVLIPVGSLGLSSVAAAAAAASPAHARPASPVHASSTCRPAIYDLGLPPGALGAVVRAHNGDLFGGGAFYPNGIEHPVLWRRTGNGQFRVRDLGLLPGFHFGHVNDINRHGQAAVFVVDGTFQSYVYDQGVRHRLRDIHGGGAAATGINDAGELVGFAFPPHSSNRAVFWRSWRARPQLLATPTRYADSGAFGINNGSVIVGNDDTADLHHFDGQLWPRPSGRPVILPPLGPGGDAAAWAINDAGTAAGQATGAAATVSPGHAAVWHGNRRPTDLGVLPGDTASLAYGISQHGRVVGLSGPADLSSSRVLYWPGRGPAKTLLPYGGAYHRRDSTEGRSVDDSGDIVGVTIHHDGQQIPTLWTCADRQAFVPPTGTQLNMLLSDHAR